MMRAWVLVFAVGCGSPSGKKDRSAPTLGGVTLSPAAPTVLDPISVVLSDVGGSDAAEVAVQWFVDGEEVSTAQTLPAGSAVRGETVSARVRLVEGGASSESVRSDAVTVVNASPQIASVSLSPSPAYADDTITVSASGSDPDDDDVYLVSVDWSVNGQWVMSSAEPELDGADWLTRDDEVQAVLTVSDGIVEVEASSEVLRISDAPGQAPVVSIAEEQTRPSEDIVCTVEQPATDPDTDADPSYRFEWTVDGAPYTGTTVTTVHEGDTVPSAATVSGESWTCDVIATLDGEELTGAAATEIVNLRPADAPDWRIFFISGHCPTCDDLNVEYLDPESDGTRAAIQARMESYGYSVETFAYVDELYNRDASGGVYPEVDGLPGHGDPEPTGVGVPDRWGFIQVLADMRYIRDNWQADFVDPTRVMFVAHSHGDVWAHQAFRTVEDLDIELTVDIDGYSMVWAEEIWPSGYGDSWREQIQDYNEEHGTALYEEASESWYVNGLGLEDVEDVLPQDNVTWCLEVQASEEWNLSAGWIHDDDDNHRPDGTTTGITTYYAASQTHSNIIEPDGEGILWVLDQLDGLYGGG